MSVRNRFYSLMNLFAVLVSHCAVRAPVPTVEQVDRTAPVVAEVGRAGSRSDEVEAVAKHADQACRHMTPLKSSLVDW